MQMHIINRLQKSILRRIICISPGAETASAHIYGIRTGINRRNHAFL